MKKILLIALILVSKIALCQSTDIDRKEFNFAFVQLPKTPVLDEKNRSYSFDINTAESLMGDKADNYLESKISILGFEKLSKNGYLTINIDLQNPIIVEKDVKTITTKSKDKSGKETIDYTFVAEIKYKQEGICKVACVDEKLNKTYSYSGIRENKSSEFSMYEDAKKYLNQFTSSVVKDAFLNEVTNSLNHHLSVDFGYSIQKGRDFLWMLANTKHSEQAKNQVAYERVKSVFEKMEFDKSVASMEKELEAAIEYYKGLDLLYKEDERKDRKIRYLAYFNLAVIYKYLDLPEKSLEWAKKLIENKYDESDGKSLLQDNQLILESFLANKVNSRHMPVNTKLDTKETEVLADDAYVLERDPAFMLAYIITSKDTVASYIGLKSIQTINKNISVRIKDSKTGKFIYRNYSAAQVKSLVLANGDEYNSVTFKEAVDAGLGAPVPKFVKQQFIGKKNTLYQYYTGELIILKTGSTIGESLSTSNWMLNSSTKMAEMAANCPTLAERATSKEFKNNLDGIKTFLKQLDTCK
ncbi:hypothetical protein DHW03_10135 [Pedobacter yonginense]|uniref:Tetratricopeptide repeat protein n=1 Tax=Pedobacter yonginense TaxID=651869 RepID=A0A317EPS0_9SPHI|nr:hypothetical protein [Pedobacter yonginense]PWS27919.1 hypothetical protein DHW03_10135 [Pedobacter yonginense]